MDESAERAKVTAMRKDIDDLRRITDELRLARPSTPEADELQRKEAALIAKIRSWSIAL